MAKIGRPRDPDHIREMKKDINRKIGTANKRIDRLKEQDLENTPAYRNLKDTLGKDRFSIKGYKGENELKRLEGQLDQFLNLQTSTVTGVKSWQRNIADTLEVDYERVSDVGKTLDNFVNILGKLTQYQRSQPGIEIESERRVTAIDKFVRESDVSLLDLDDTESVVKAIDDMMREEEEISSEYLDPKNWFGENGE